MLQVCRKSMEGFCSVHKGVRGGVHFNRKVYQLWFLSKTKEK